jgi:hypothetical protein
MDIANGRLASELSFWRRLVQNPMVDVGVMALMIASIAHLAATLPARRFSFDFNHFYVSGRLFLEGKNAYTTSLEPLSHELGVAYADDIPTASYPPLFLWLFAGVATLEPQAAFILWVAMQAASLGVVLWVTRRLLGERLSPRGWRFVYAGAVMSQTVYSHFYFSQVQLMLAALVLGAYAWYRAGKNVPACLAVTVAGAAKLYPFVLLPWFVWRGGNSTRARVRLLGWSVALLMMIVLLTGPGLWRDFFRFVSPGLAGFHIGRNYNFSVPAMIINMGYAIADFPPTATAAHVWWLVGAAGGFAVIGLAYVVSWRCDSDPEAEFCFLTLAMLAATLSTQGHYFVWLIFPAAAAAARIVANFSAWRAICLALVLFAVNDLAPLAGTFLDRHLYLKVVLNNIPLYGLALLGVFFWRELRRR